MFPSSYRQNNQLSDDKSLSLLDNDALEMEVEMQQIPQTSIGQTSYRLSHGVEISIRREPRDDSPLTGRKLQRGSSFQAAEHRTIGNQTWVRLQDGGWVFLYHPKNGTHLADPVANASTSMPHTSMPHTEMDIPMTSTDTDDELEQLLDKLKLTEYLESFRANGCDQLATVALMQEDELRDQLGMKFGHAKLLRQHFIAAKLQ